MFDGKAEAMSQCAKPDIQGPPFIWTLGVIYRASKTMLVSLQWKGMTKPVRKWLCGGPQKSRPTPCKGKLPIPQMAMAIAKAMGWFRGTGRCPSWFTVHWPTIIFGLLLFLSLTGSWPVCLSVHLPLCICCLLTYGPFHFSSTPRGELESW